jgi:hypothetical protein
MSQMGLGAVVPAASADRSASPSIAAASLQRRELTKCANNGSHSAISIDAVEAFFTSLRPTARNHPFAVTILPNG